MENRKKFNEQFAQYESVNIPLIIENPLNDLSKRYDRCCQGYGAMMPSLAFIGSIPSNFDMEKGKPFSDKIGQSLRHIVEYFQSKKIKHFYYTNFFWYNPEIITLDLIAREKQRLTDELIIIKPLALVIIGEQTAEYFGKFSDLRLQRSLIQLNIFYYSYFLTDLRKSFFDKDKYKTIIKEDIDFIANDLKHLPQSQAYFL